MAVRYTDLITVAELKAAAFGEAAGKATDSDTAAVERLIGDVTSTIETYLERSLIAHATTQRFARRAWEACDEHPSYAYEAWAGDWPLFEVTTAGVEAGPARPGGQLLYSNSAPQTVMGYAGFRRRDQTLLVLQAALDDAGETPLAEMTELPPVLPSDIRDVAIDLCLYRILGRSTGSLYSRRVINMPHGAVTMEQMTRGFEASALSRLNPYRRSPW